MRQATKALTTGKRQLLRTVGAPAGAGVPTISSAAVARDVKLTKLCDQCLDLCRTLDRWNMGEVSLNEDESDKIIHRLFDLISAIAAKKAVCAQARLAKAKVAYAVTKDADDSYSPSRAALVRSVLAETVEGSAVA